MRLPSVWDNRDKFTDSVFQVLSSTQAQAAHDGCDAIRPEHILLALATVRPGPGRVALERLGVDLSEHISEIAGLMPLARGGVAAQEPVLGADAAAVLESAKTQALSLGHNYVGTEHLVMGLLLCKDCPAASFLRQHSISLKAFRDEVVLLLSGD